MFQSIQDRCEALVKNFKEIPAERRELLEIIADYIINKRDANEAINLVYVCTHNSRRSHLGQVWAAVAAAYYKVDNVHTFSGGTEATAFNPNAIRAITAAGFSVKKTDETNN